MVNKSTDTKGVFKSVFIAYFILILHVVLISLIGLLVLFFSGIVNYIFWIFLAGSISIIAGGYFIFRRMKKEGKTLQNMLSIPVFRGRAVEVSLLGGLASLKVGKPDDRMLGIEAPGESNFQLEDPETIHMRELTELVRLYENNLITEDEFIKAKKCVLK